MRLEKVVISSTRVKFTIRTGNVFSPEWNHVRYYIKENKVSCSCEEDPCRHASFLFEELSDRFGISNGLSDWINQRNINPEACLFTPFHADQMVNAFARHYNRLKNDGPKSASLNLNDLDKQQALYSAITEWALKDPTSPLLQDNWISAGVDKARGQDQTKVIQFSTKGKRKSLYDEIESYTEKDEEPAKPRTRFTDLEI